MMELLSELLSSPFLLFIALISSLIGLILPLSFFRESLFKKKSLLDSNLNSCYQQQTAENVVNRLENLNNEVNLLKTKLVELSTLPEEKKLQITLSELNRQILEIDGRLKAFESALQQEPAKVLSVAILTKDFEYFKSSYQMEQKAIKAEILQKVDEKIILQLRFLAAGVLGLGIGVFTLLLKMLLS
ncbi:MAG TPA: hypothetical protein EYP59_19365 [Thiotrichaceae bacterium]|nr:hypothetical protein [Thiotrichaceae bacterium]